MTEDAPPPGKQVRAFVALPLPDALRAGVADTVARLKGSLPDVRYVHDHGAHVTLRFLGWTDAETLAAIEGPLRAAAAECPPALMAVRGWACSRSGVAAIPWMGLGCRRGPSLQARCEQAGSPPVSSPSRAVPSAPYARAWRARSRPHPPDVELGSRRRGPLVLYRSDLGSAGLYPRFAASRWRAPSSVRSNLPNQWATALVRPRAVLPTSWSIPFSYIVARSRDRVRTWGGTSGPPT